MINKISIVIMFLTFAIMADSYAATYHVRKDGHDKASGANDTSNASTGALLTINHCLSAHATSPGDTCKIHTGTYNEIVTTAHSGTAGNLITIKADSADIVAVNRVNINKHNYIKINGLVITKSSYYGSAPGILVVGNNCLISANKITGSGVNPADNAYALQTYGKNNTIDKNVIDGESTYILSFFIVFGVNGTGNIFTNNIVKNVANVERIWDGGGCDRRYPSSDNTVVSGNEAYAAGWDGKTNHPDIFQFVDAIAGCGVTNTSNNWIIENNYFHDMDLQGGLDEMPPTRGSGLIFRNNVYANILQENMFTGFGMHFENNTFFNCGPLDDHALVAIQLASGYTESIKNNIFIGRSKRTEYGMRRNAIWSAGWTIDASNNYYGLPNYSARSPAAFNALGEANSINGGDPKFVAAYDNCIKNACDFRIQKGSPLIDAGADLSASWPSATDKNGVTRPQGAAWDIGAYEYKDPDPPQPTPSLKIK